MPTVTFVLYSLSGEENRDGCGQSFEPKTAKNKENTSEPAYVVLSSHRRISQSNVQSLKSNWSKDRLSVAYLYYSNSWISKNYIYNAHGNNARHTAVYKVYSDSWHCWFILIENEILGSEFKRRCKSRSSAGSNSSGNNVFYIMHIATYGRLYEKNTSFNLHAWSASAYHCYLCSCSPCQSMVITFPNALRGCTSRLARGRRKHHHQ